MRPKGFEKIVVVTKRTALEELVERFNTRDQAKFYIESLGEDFSEYLAAHNQYERALTQLKAGLPAGYRVQFLERAMVPTYLFGETDMAVTLGPDGLVVNVAKYLKGQPLLAFNPDPSRMDGVLVPFRYEAAATLFGFAVRGALAVRDVTMAQAVLNDGQRLLAVNDLFIGAASHVSARYSLRYRGEEERHSSSGVLVSTGAGSTGWLRSIATGAQRIAMRIAEGIARPGDAAAETLHPVRFSVDSRQLVWAVREPFESRISSARLVYGILEADQLEIASSMPQNGVIFSDGVEQDYLAFNAGAVAKIGLAPETLKLMIG